MQFFVVYSVLVTVLIGSAAAFPFLDGLVDLFQPSSGCTILVEVPLTPRDPYFKFELFPSLTDKLNANQDRFNRDLHQVWVDAPDPSICGYSTFGGGRCVLNGHFAPQYKWLVFKSGERKKIANEQLWEESRVRNLPYYNVYADAPDRYCKRQSITGGQSFGGLLDYLG